MIQKEFYYNLKEALESDYFTKLLIDAESISIDAKRRLLVKAIYFLISTRNFKEFQNYLNHYYKGLFPYEYLRETTHQSEEQIKTIIYNNFIRNGFLFHITPSKNITEILNSGLKTLNDKYNCDLYQKSINLNKTYSQIRKRNSEHTDLFALLSLVKIPGLEQYHEDRFKTVYLSSNLDYILKTYGESGELFNFFIRDLLWAFNNSDNIDELTKQELREKIIQIITNSHAKIYDDEIIQILDFFDTIYESKNPNPNNDKAILLIPTETINSNSSYFNGLYKENRLNLSPDSIINFHDGEIGSSQSIPPEDIIAIDHNQDKSLCLKIKK